MFWDPFFDRVSETLGAEADQCKVRETAPPAAFNIAWLLTNTNTAHLLPHRLVPAREHLCPTTRQPAQCRAPLLPRRLDLLPLAVPRPRQGVPRAHYFFCHHVRHRREPQGQEHAVDCVLVSLSLPEHKLTVASPWATSPSSAYSSLTSLTSLYSRQPPPPHVPRHPRHLYRDLGHAHGPRYEAHDVCLERPRRSAEGRGAWIGRGGGPRRGRTPSTGTATTCRILTADP